MAGRRSVHIVAVQFPSAVTIRMLTHPAFFIVMEFFHCTFGICSPCQFIKHVILIRHTVTISICGCSYVTCQIISIMLAALVCMQNLRDSPPLVCLIPRMVSVTVYNPCDIACRIIDVLLPASFSQHFFLLLRVRLYQRIGTKYSVLILQCPFVYPTRQNFASVY